MNRIDNVRMAALPWQHRIHRARELAAERKYAAEVLGFYIHLARFQENLYRQLAAVLQSPAASLERELVQTELSELSARFESFLSLCEIEGPEPMGGLCRELRMRGQQVWPELLNGAWIARTEPDASGFLALAFLQPYAELLRLRCPVQPKHGLQRLCPFCCRKPGVGVLRPVGEGGARSLICSLCAGEWEFRRIVCAACGEEDPKKLPVFTASDSDYIRLECCETCKTYLKTVDLTKNGRAEPIVDELGSGPLDLWARERGYAKLQANLLGL